MTFGALLDRRMPPSCCLGRGGIDDVDAPSAVDGTYLQTAEKLFAEVRKGDVALVSGRWLLERAGYQMTDGGRYVKSATWWWTLAATQGSLRSSLPNRQQLEAEHPEALITVEALERNYRAFCSTVEAAVNGYDGRSASEDGVDAVPVISVSHCWESENEPDPHARTLATVAEALAQLWPDFTCWGFDDVGVFFDWSSLYQDKPVPRTGEEQASFERAIDNMSIWFAHRLVTVFLIADQQNLGDRPRTQRGWPFYEEAMARLLKDEPRGTPYVRRAAQSGLEQHGAPHPTSSQAAPPLSEWPQIGVVWPKVSEISSSRQAVPTADGPPWRRGPPFSAASFEAALAQKSFTNKADPEKVKHLYRRTLHDGLGLAVQLSYPRAGWGNEQVAELAKALNEVKCPHVKMLKLTFGQMESIDAIGEAIEGGALPALEVLVLAMCKQLTHLPESIGRLANLRVLVLSDCVQLLPRSSLPRSLGRLKRLKELDLRGCKDDEKEVLSLVPGELRTRTGLNIMKKKSVVNRNFEQSDKWRLSDYTA